MGISIESLFSSKWKTDPIIVEYSSVIIDAVYSKVNIDLDFSPDTVSLLDYYVNEIGDVDKSMFSLMSTISCAYFGELVRRNIGGQWYIEDKDNPENWQVRFNSCPLAIYPFILSSEVISKGKFSLESSIFSVSPSRHDLLLELLEKSNPMAEDQYYSFAGKLDIIELAVDFLSSVENELHEKSKKPITKFGNEDPQTVKCLPLSVIDTKNKKK